MIALIFLAAGLFFFVGFLGHMVALAGALVGAPYLIWLSWRLAKHSKKQWAAKHPDPPKRAAKGVDLPSGRTLWFDGKDRLVSIEDRDGSMTDDRGIPLLGSDDDGMGGDEGDGTCDCGEHCAVTA